jgi:hypothetical protein
MHLHYPLHHTYIPPSRLAWAIGEQSHDCYATLRQRSNVTEGDNMQQVLCVTWSSLTLCGTGGEIITRCCHVLADITEHNIWGTAPTHPLQPVLQHITRSYSCADGDKQAALWVASGLQYMQNSHVIIILPSSSSSSSSSSRSENFHYLHRDHCITD